MAEEIKKGSLGTILSDCNIITEQDILRAIEEQGRSGIRFGEALIKLGIVTQEDIDWALSNQLDLPYIRLKANMIDPAAIRLIPAATARKFNLVPLIKAGNELNIAISDPLNKSAIAAAEQQSGCQISISVALVREIREMIETFYGSSGQEQLGFTSNAFSEKVLEIINSDLSGSKLLDYLLIFVTQNRLSSLSLQHMGDIITISGKRGGVTSLVGSLANTFYSDLIIKIRKSIDSKASDTPNSGGLLTLNYHSRPITFHIAMISGYGGEYVTITPHLSATVPRRLADLHLPAGQEADFLQLSRKQQGITFFASQNIEERNHFIDMMLEEIDTTGKNVIVMGEGLGKMTKSFPGIILHGNENERASTIMAVLDHAPDILVIENIADIPSFTAACRAAMRGKHVLAGLETRGTDNTLRQLLQYQQQHYFLPIFVNGMISFKGIKLLCPECRISYTPSALEIAAMNLEKQPAEFFRSVGCHACGYLGFKSKKFLTDVLVFNDGFLKTFEQSVHVSDLKDFLKKEDYQGMGEEGLRLLMNGEISPEEYIAAVVL